MSTNFCMRLATINLNGIMCQAKQSLLRDFIKINDIDIIFLQEVNLKSFPLLVDHDVILNFSDLSRTTAVAIRKGLDYKDVIVDPNGRIISFLLNGINYVNIYAQSGSQFKKERNDFFTEEISIHINRHFEGVIIGGDFNCFLNAKDTNGAMNFCQGLQQLVDKMKLTDVSNHVLKNINFTFFRGSSASRLDRFYFSNGMLDRIKEVKTVPLAFSDHHSVIVKLNINQKPTITSLKQSYWKLNSVLLNNDDLAEQYQHKLEAVKNRQKYQSDFNKWWNDDFKNSTRSFYKSYTINRNIEIMNEKSSCYRAMLELSSRLNAGEDVHLEMNFIKKRLFEIETQKLKEFSKVFQPNNLAEQEKVGIFQIAQHCERKVSTNQLRVGNETTTDKKKIKEEFFNYYQRIFENSDSQATQLNYQSLDFIDKKLSVQEIIDLVQPIDETELLNVILEASKKKSPGRDGLSYEFYKRYFDSLKEDMLKLFNNYLVDGILSPANFKEGIVTFIPKHGNPGVTDFRPISLLNTDYKLFAKLLANRIKSALPSLIGPFQTACVEGKSCIDNLTILRNLVASANGKKSFKFAILSLDLEKAFDRVDRRYLWAVLEKYGFPLQFIKCLRNLYENSSSKLLVAGSLTESIKINNSVRQGCPLSMILFALYLEPLLIMLSKEIPGILVDGAFILLIAYADDINVIIKSRKDFNAVIKLMKLFSKDARISLNYQKSTILYFNGFRLDSGDIKEVQDSKILGVVFKNNWEDTVTKNYTVLLNNIKFMIFQMKFRKLNMIQKIWVLNTFVLSKLWYIGQILPASNKFVAEITKIIGKYLWMGHLFKIQRNQLYLSKEKGGLDLIHVGYKIKALFVRNLLFTSEKAGSVPKLDLLFKDRKKLKLNRTFADYSRSAEEISKLKGINTCKKIYYHFLEKDSTNPSVAIKNPTIIWENVWPNIHQKFIDSNCQMLLYNFVNDIIPTRYKMHKHKIRGISDQNCNNCGQVDDKEHRLKTCEEKVNVWNYVQELIVKKLKVEVNDPLEILERTLGRKNEKLALFILATAMHCNLKNMVKSKEDFKNILNNSLKSSHKILDKNFGNFVELIK